MQTVHLPLDRSPLHTDFPFDPTYGYDVNSLLGVALPGTEPTDFSDFWRGTYQASSAVPPRPTITPGWSDDGFTVSLVEFDALGDEGTGTRRIGGWLVLPPTAPRYGVVWGHGYGGRAEPAIQRFRDPPAVLYPCARGFDRSASPELPNGAAKHVLHGIGARETYLHRGCCADIWAAASALLELVPDIDGRLGYAGGSFGGGIGALAVPWDRRFARCVLDVPSFGHHPLRLTMPCVGSGESVRQHYANQPEVVEVLRYFDAATAATYMHCPTLVTPAVFDPAVPPPGQFAVFNAMECEKRAVCRDWAHVDWPHPEELAIIEAEVEVWLAATGSTLA